MLAQNSAEPEHLTDREKELIGTLKLRMIRTRIDLPALANEIGVELPTLRSLNRIGIDSDEVPEALSGAQKADAFRKIAEWIEVIESEDDTIERVERRMAGYHTISGLAQKLNLDETALGQLISGATEHWGAHEHAYKRTMLRRLEDWLESDIANDMDGLAQTPTFKAVQEGCELAVTSGGIVIMPGEPGIGKSMALKDFCRRIPKTRSSRGAVYIRFETGDTTEKAINERIVTTLYDQGLITSTSGDHKRIIKQTLGDGDILLLDEFQFTVAGGNRGGEVFHSLHDTTGIPLVLVGNATMNQELLNGKKQPFAALVNRAIVLGHMQTTEEDVRIWMLSQGYKNATLIKEAQRLCARPGQSGGLRTLAIVIRNFEKRFPGEKLTQDTLLINAAFCGKAP